MTDHKIPASPKPNPSIQYQLRPTSSMVILLGGVPGVGKTTIGNALLVGLGLTHHISTGFLRAAIDDFLPEDKAKLIRRQAFNAYEELVESDKPDGERILSGCIAQTELLKPIFKACIARATREGIGLVLEGSHFIPGVIDPQEYGADLLCVLDVPNREELKTRALSRNHLNRSLSNYDLERLIQLQDQILMMARRQKHPIVINNDLGDAVCQIQGLVGA